MSHLLDSCDFIDMLEESAKMHRSIIVTLTGGARFEDMVRDLVTEDGQDFVLFRDHGRYPARDVLDCVWTAPRSESYDAKL